MPTETTLRLRIGDTPAIVAGLAPKLLFRLHDLVRPFVVETFDTSLERLERLERLEAVQLRVSDVEDDRYGTRWIVYLRDEEICSHTRADELLQYLEWLAISQAIAATERYAVFHAAALMCDALTVMLVGPSGAGKSTLALNLIQRGWQPLTDDTALVDNQTDAIHPFPRCFHVEPARASHTENHSDFEWPAGLAGYARPVRWAAGAHPATAVFLVERDPVGPSRCVPIMQASGAGALFSQAMHNRLSPAQTARVAVRVAGGARCYQLTNGNLESALDLITSPSDAPSS